MRPQDLLPWTLLLHFTEEDPLNIRSQLNITGLRPAGASRTMSVTSFGSPTRLITVARRLHKYTHAPLREIIDHLSRTCCPNIYASNICNEFIDSCAVCKRPGHPASSKMLSLAHIDKAFNPKVQTDSIFAKIGRPYTVYYMLLTSERAIRKHLWERKGYGNNGTDFSVGQCNYFTWRNRDFWRNSYSTTFPCNMWKFSPYDHVRLGTQKDGDYLMIEMSS